MNKLFIIFTFIIICGCKTTSDIVSYREFSDYLSKYRTTKLIQLDTIKSDNKNYIEFENRNSVIYISFEEFKTYANQRKNDSICIPKKTALEEILKMLAETKNDCYIIKRPPS